MRQVTDLKEIQSLALKILIQVDEFCKDHEIDYFLAYGTLLGAVRHKGFIPWDDDIDIWMKRDNFNRLVTEFPEWGKKHGLYINAAETVDKYNRVHAQICMENSNLIPNDRHNPFREGYFIDIFPLDGTPNNSINRWVRLKRLQFLKNIATLSAYGADQKENASKTEKGIGKVAKLFRNIDTRKLMLKYGRIAEKSNCDSSEFLQLLPNGRKRGGVYLLPSESFKSVVPIQFETITSMAPSGYDAILKSMYGNYMEFPPGDARKPHHDFKLYIDEDI